ncbi:MAG: response regulator [Pseudobdellovibrionaceae bacterium]|nr:response regulator [Pseudobdellovibrionaceae bacterium]
MALSGVKILIIDDEPDVLEIIKLILAHYQAEVIATSSAMEGLEHVQSYRPDVIVSDIGMPQMDGYQFIRKVRDLPQHNGGQTPAVALTAFSRPEDQIKALEAGFQRHLSKPVDLQRLIDTIASVTGETSH